MASVVSAKHLYREAMEQVHSYNSKLLLDRRLRMPYIDNQTGLAQQDCHLWVSRVQRCSPLIKGQIYSYPSRRWMVRKRPDFVGASKSSEKKSLPDIEEGNQDIGLPLENDKSTGVDVKSEEVPIAAEAPVAITAPVYDDFYDDEAFDSDLDSDEEFGSRKKKRKTGGRGNKNNKKNNTTSKFGDNNKWSGRVGNTKDDVNKSNVEEKKKSYVCNLCSKRYKNPQSLRYHYEHHNHNLNAGGEPQMQVGTEPQPNPEPQPIQDQPPPDHVTGAKRQKGMPPSSYCDFCVGSVGINKKSGSPEELISCADCGRSGHPSCLQFNQNLTEQVKKYKWQCIECKCCCICGTSDNDEQLLFCDDCDRGYHMYCLSPPISEPPEGSWQCQLCEARVNGLDIMKVAVLRQHMDKVLMEKIPMPEQTSSHSSSLVGHLPPVTIQPAQSSTPEYVTGPTPIAAPVLMDTVNIPVPIPPVLPIVNDTVPTANNEADSNVQPVMNTSETAELNTKELPLTGSDTLSPPP